MMLYLSVLQGEQVFCIANFLRLRLIQAGLADLLDIMETKVLEATGRRKVKLRVTNGGDDYRYDP